MRTAYHLYSVPLKTYDPSLIIEKHQINPNGRNVYEKNLTSELTRSSKPRKVRNCHRTEEPQKTKPKKPHKKQKTTQCNVVSWMGSLNNNKTSLEENRGIQIIKDFT